MLDTNEPSPGLYICADGDPINRHWISYYWSSLIIAESVFLGLSLYKAYSNWKTGEGGPLMKALTRDSVLYFVWYVPTMTVCVSKIADVRPSIFVIYVANQVIWLRNDVCHRISCYAIMLIVPNFSLDHVKRSRDRIFFLHHSYSCESTDARSS